MKWLRPASSTTENANFGFGAVLRESLSPASDTKRITILTSSNSYELKSGIIIQESGKLFISDAFITLLTRHILVPLIHLPLLYKISQSMLWACFRIYDPVSFDRLTLEYVIKDKPSCKPFVTLWFLLGSEID
ncbi:hypothetical protein Tcan_18821 [Toxocara canis]|uniref:Uncharacterized protein n=1 Tax=Toxocara canis TaxID=6265 RepID=A0A0B2VKN3_TOXCA|nr:hypothetical protein Tcan_18821 [Toxocara canis]